MKPRTVLTLFLMLLMGIAAAAPFARGGESNPNVSSTEMPREVARRVQERAQRVDRAKQQQSEERHRRVENPPGRAQWTMNYSADSAGSCVNVIVAQIDGDDDGTLGACWEASQNPLLGWSIGGMEIGSEFFNVAYGVASRAASSARVILADGTVVSDADVRRGNGLWILVVAAEPTEPGSDIVRIEILDDAGLVIAREDPPSLVAARRQASGLAGTGQGD